MSLYSYDFGVEQYLIYYATFLHNFVKLRGKREDREQIDNRWCDRVMKSKNFIKKKKNVKS